MKINEVLGELLKGYEREYAEKLKSHDEALKKYPPDISDYEYRNLIHAKRILMDAFIAHGKAKAAREILAALAEESNENSQGRQADS